MRFLSVFLICLMPAFLRAEMVTVHPVEDPQMVLHNPDMGWVIYENYPIDSDPHGSSSLLELPNEDFPQVDQVAVMFSWADVEKTPDRYDFSKVDFAYDYWKKRGKEIQLRMSTESLLWWDTRNPPTGYGVPQYVLDQLPPTAKLQRKLEGIPYMTVDAREPFYLQRLARFLTTVEEHYGTKRPVTLVDLRGFGVWGEWHSGFKYPDVEARHAALSGVLDVWSKSMPHHRLALSYSYDPDSPASYHAGPTNRFDEKFTSTFQEFMHYSAFDHALTLPNITFRRDGVGGAVHSNERKLLELAFAQGKGPMFCEFMGGYGDALKGGTKWVNWIIDDALSQHPNFINLLGYSGGDAQNFCRQRPDLVKKAALSMGYRLVPTEWKYPSSVRVGESFSVYSLWVNRGIGRCVSPSELSFLLKRDGKVIEISAHTPLPTNTWIAGHDYEEKASVQFEKAGPGRCELWMNLLDPKDGKPIQLPLAGSDSTYPIGEIELTQ
jgi:hypothetical protein